MDNALVTTGWVVMHDDGPAKFVGTCFGFRRPEYLLTAAHCVRGIDRDALSIGMVYDRRPERGLSIEELHIHPTADVAIVRITDALQVFDFFRGYSGRFRWGDDLTAFGYPEDTVADGVAPTPRYFRGHVQRTFDYESTLGYEYRAIELSFGAPGGLSGGPVALRKDSSRAIGIVTENIRSTTYLESIVEVIDGAERYREQVHNVINYGVAVQLDAIRDWLNVHVPSRHERQFPPRLRA